MGDHHNHHNAKKNQKIAFYTNLGFTLLEIVGGFFTNSIAIISDALHDLGDSLSLGPAWYIENKAKKKELRKSSVLGIRIETLNFILNEENYFSYS